jgi:hypothetical protein
MQSIAVEGVECGFVLKTWVAHYQPHLAPHPQLRAQKNHDSAQPADSEYRTPRDANVTSGNADPSCATSDRANVNECRAFAVDGITTANARNACALRCKCMRSILLLTL